MNKQHASLYLRMLAGLTDLSIVFLVHMLALYLVMQQSSLGSFISSFILYLIVIALNPFVLYFQIFFLHFWGGSPGKLLCGLMVYDNHGSFLSLKTAFLRQTLGYQLSGILFGLGFMAILKDPKHLAWHDKAVGSQVIITRNNWFFGVLMTLVCLIGGMYLLVQGIISFSKNPIPSQISTMMRNSNIQPVRAPEDPKYNNTILPTPPPRSRTI